MSAMAAAPMNLCSQVLVRGPAGRATDQRAVGSSDMIENQLKKRFMLDISTFWL